jgi:cell division protein FtsB
MQADTGEKQHSNSLWQPLATAALVVALGAMAYVQVNMRHEQERMTRTIAELAEKQQTRIDALESRAETLEQDTSTLHSQTATATNALKDTQRRLTQTHTATLTEIKKQQALTAQTAAQLSDLSQVEDNRYGSITGEVTAVKGNLDETRTNLDGVKSKLDRTVGDLGVQSGLIARNHEELADLKRRGERDYAEFDLKKSKDFTRVSDLGLQLTKADAKKQKYTVAVMVADKRLEKKDKTALEPLQLYMPGGHKLVEIVVWDVNKDRVVGYVSSPKQ